MTTNLDQLFTARWHLNAGLAVPTGGPREALLALLGEKLGQVPGPVAAPVEAAAASEAGVIRIPAERWLVPSSKSFPIVGRALKRVEFPRYLAGIEDEDMTWDPQLVVIHHTAAPALATRPVGFQGQHMLNMRHGYIHERGFRKGPHFFIDEDEVWVFSPVTSLGTHAKAYNSTGIGVEMLGDFDVEDPSTGRGREVLESAIQATAFLLDRFGLNEADIRFHRDDPRTDKTCPGRKVDKARFVEAVKRFRSGREVWW